MKNSANRQSTLLVTVILGLVLAATLYAAPALNLSGYEFLLGTNCTIQAQAGTCGVQFGGWTGGGGQVAGGWTTFPGNRRGLWAASINYIGTANFDSQVIVVGGTYDVLFKNAKPRSGEVIGGTVTWPLNATTDAGCGPGVAIVSLTLTGDATSFAGCLHDLPAGSVIPPQIWGTLE